MIDDLSKDESTPRYIDCSQSHKLSIKYSNNTLMIDTEISLDELQI